MDREVKTKKALGQHWLYDIDVLTEIAETAEIVTDDNIVEVGPGLGTLTEVLLSYGAKVTAVEYDTELYIKLKQDSKKLFSTDASRLEIVNEDILSFRFDELPAGYKVVANIPYYLTSNLIRLLSETPNQPSVVVLLIQKEVAERLCAGPGGMSLLSVWAQMYFECNLRLVVPAKLFTPPPKVDSQVVLLKLRDKPVFGDIDKKILTQVLKAGFSNKRKTLHNSISSGMHISKDISKELLEASGIPLSSRPQELNLKQWITLAKNYKKLNT